MSACSTPPILTTFRAPVINRFIPKRRGAVENEPDTSQEDASSLHWTTPVPRQQPEKHMRRYRLSVLVLPLVFIPFVLFGGCSSETTSPEKPNIVFILADDMGYGDVTSYNSESQIPTPHLDTFASQGMQFTDAHAPATVCMPSRYGLLTGRHPHRIQSEEWRERALIRENQTTIPTLLEKRGYETYMIGKWHLGFKNGTDYNCSQPLRGGPTDHGFDHYFGIPASLDQPPYFYIRDNRCVEAPTDSIAGNQSDDAIWTDIQGAFWRGGGIAPNFSHREVLPRFTEETLSYLNAHREDRAQTPFFMYLALAAPHTPWLPPDSLRGSSDAGLYGDFVTQVDGAVGRVLDTLDRLGMRENTLIIFASDNGPVWYSEDEEHFDHRSTHVYRGMKGDAWEGGHRIPFIARWPDRIPEGTTQDQLLTFTDMASTFADLAGPSLSPDSTDGYNLRPVLTGARDSVARDGAVFESIHYVTIRDGPWKLIPGLGSGGFISTPPTREPGPADPTGQLYHLGRDPAEETNLYDERPDVVQRLMDRVDKYRKQQP